MRTRQISYAAATFASPPSGQRIPRAQQAAAANALLMRLRSIPHTASSKSHSRTLVAAAVGDAEELQLGVDVEWMSPDRPIEEIMRCIVPVLPAGCSREALYFGWTFFEAYYKAFQRPPSDAEIVSLVVSPAGQPRRLPSGICVLQQSIEQNFALSLVWRSSQICTLRRVDPDPD